MFVKPAAGLQVRDPFTRRHLPEEGAEVPETAEWHQMLAQGDVELAEPKAAAVEVEPPTTPPATNEGAKT